MIDTVCIGNLPIKLYIQIQYFYNNVSIFQGILGAYNPL